MRRAAGVTLFALLLGLWMAPHATAETWVSDLGNGRYQNPILFADYSDPDLVRVGDAFYMVASSFNVMPGIPVLHSKDLVNWTILGHVYDRLPLSKYDKPAHGQGSWAPSIRFHEGRFYVYFCTPNDGLFMAVAADPAGPWELHQVAAVELWEDPCPFWDDDGSAYLVRSKVRADVLYLHRMSPDGRKLLDNGTVVFEDTKRQPVIEGPKLFKKDGWYYILAPAGGVPTGWQAVLRSRSLYGPYEDRVVLHQGATAINGPHQGGLVELESGEWWFVHFQDRGVYGRVVHLQPVEWKDGWPRMGQDIDGDGIGEPVAEWTKPDVGAEHPVRVPQTTDELGGERLGLQWQWHANPQEGWYSLAAQPGSLRLYTVKNLTQHGNLWFVPNLLLQKVPAPSFTLTTRIHFVADRPHQRSGLLVMGRQWSFLALTSTPEGTRLGMFTGKYDQGRDGTREIESVAIEGSAAFLRVHFEEGGACTWSYSLDGEEYTTIGETVAATPGVWIGAKVGLFAVDPNIGEGQGYADFDTFRFE